MHPLLLGRLAAAGVGQAQLFLTAQTLLELARNQSFIRLFRRLAVGRQAAVCTKPAAIRRLDVSLLVAGLALSAPQKLAVLVVLAFAM